MDIKKELTDLLEECDTMKEAFTKIKHDDITLKIKNLGNNDSSKITILEPKTDYAIIEVKGDSFDVSNKGGVYVHPYGGSIGYTLNDNLY